MIDTVQKIYLMAVGVVALGYSSLMLAQEYVPPPAGPYKPEVIVSDAPALSSEKSAEKVYKFPSEDLIRGEAPPALSFDTPAASGQQSEQRINHQSAQRSNNTATHTGSGAAIPGSNYHSSAQASQPTTDRLHDSNPWAPSVSTMQPQQPVYRGSSSWYPPQYGYGYPQQYPYGYGTQDYYGNAQNDANAPFSNMPTPWNMMPMQPFFPGR